RQRQRPTALRHRAPRGERTYRPTSRRRRARWLSRTGADPSWAAQNYAWISFRASFRRGATRGDFGRAFDSCTNPEVRRTAAKIASHRAVDLIVVRTWVALEQRRCRHDLG